MKIVFATNNAHKLSEIRSIMGNDIEILSLDDINCHDDIPETADTLEGNAMQKAEYIYGRYGMSVFADDTGLEVEALGGEPGIYSARYAGGNGHDSRANMSKLLMRLGGNTNRRARFRTVIALILKDDDGENGNCGNNRNNGGESSSGITTHTFEGIVNGSITEDGRGGEGFGYDPIFMPEGYDLTFAELGNDIKNRISHRAKAVAGLYAFLSNRCIQGGTEHQPAR